MEEDDIWWWWETDKTSTPLSSLSIYTIYQLQEGVHQQMDSIMANFFWQWAK
jgi:hypothetical protein